MGSVGMMDEKSRLTVTLSGTWTDASVRGADKGLVPKRERAMSL